MSHVPPKTRSVKEIATRGLPTWSGVLIVIAALLTGLFISLANHALGTAFLACFVVGSIAVALFTEPRGLFIAVSAIPISFGVFSVLTAWIIGRQLSAGGTSAFSTTSMITSIFPFFQFFWVLLITTAVAIAIAVARVQILNRNLKHASERRSSQRRRDAELDKRNRDTVNRARQQSTRRAPMDPKERQAQRQRRDHYRARSRQAVPIRPSEARRQQPRRPSPQQQRRQPVRNQTTRQSPYRGAMNSNRTQPPHPAESRSVANRRPPRSQSVSSSQNRNQVTVEELLRRDHERARRLARQQSQYERTRRGSKEPSRKDIPRRQVPRKRPTDLYDFED